MYSLWHTSSGDVVAEDVGSDDEVQVGQAIQAVQAYGHITSIESGTRTKTKKRKAECNQEAKYQRISPAAVPAPTCPHSQGNDAPVCWDCMEDGHVTDFVEGSPPGCDSPRPYQKHSRRREDNSSWGGSTLRGRPSLDKSSMLPEWHPPEPGLEAQYLFDASMPGNQVSELPFHESSLPVAFFGSISFAFYGVGDVRSPFSWSLRQWYRKTVTGVSLVDLIMLHFLHLFAISLLCTKIVSHELTPTCHSR